MPSLIFDYHPATPFDFFSALYFFKARRRFCLLRLCEFFRASCFMLILLVSLLNLILPAYGGAFLALLSSLYLGYDPTAGPMSVLVGTFYSLIAGAVAGGLFGWLYNRFVERF
jgi:hypothetical protein